MLETLSLSVFWEPLEEGQKKSPEAIPPQESLAACTALSELHRYTNSIQ